MEFCPKCGSTRISRRDVISTGSHWGCDNCGYESSDTTVPLNSPGLHILRKEAQSGEKRFVEAARIAAEEKPE